MSHTQLLFRDAARAKLPATREEPEPGEAG